MTDFLKNPHFNEWISFLSFLEANDPANLTFDFRGSHTYLKLFHKGSMTTYKIWIFGLQNRKFQGKYVDTFQKVKIDNYR